MKRIALILIIMLLPIAGLAANPGLISPSPEILSYRSGTQSRITAAERAIRKGQYEKAIELATELLAYEPRCMEAYWVLALAHQSRNETGLMMDALASIGIREASESSLAISVVQRGSQGYVLSAADRTLTIDYGLTSGATIGQKFIVYAEGEALQHPITFQILYVEKRPMAEVEIINLFASHAVVEIVKQYGQVEMGMRVAPKDEYDFSVELINTALRP